jgi:CDP-6-deoxy-D-xylo-4-hexulose-3-dehydrase
MKIQTTQEEIEAVTQVLLSNRHADGPVIREFERALATFLGAPATVAVNSGSIANRLALAQICEGSPKARYGIIPACSFATTFNAVLEENLTPIVLDANPETLLPSAEDVKEAIDRFPDSILIIGHMMGVAWPGVAERWDVPLLEDCCDAFGAAVKGRRVGTFGEFGAFSFYPAHHINCAGGGAISFTQPPDGIELRHAREWGRLFVEGAAIPNGMHELEARYTYVRRGGNFLMNELQAALGVTQLKRAEEFIRKRNANHEYILKRLDEQGVLSYLRPVRSLPETEPSWFGFPAVLEEPTRLELIRFLGKRGIQCRPIIGGNVLRQPAYKTIRFEQLNELDGSNILHDRAFFVASHPYLTTDEMEHLVGSLEAFFSA